MKSLKLKRVIERKPGGEIKTAIIEVEEIFDGFKPIEITEHTVEFISTDEKVGQAIFSKTLPKNLYIDCINEIQLAETAND